MASSSKAPVNVFKISSDETPSNKPETSTLRYDELRLVTEQSVDFESLRINQHDLRGYFETQGWIDYFDMLNGSIYPYLVKDFWLRAEVFDKDAANRELQAKIEEDPEKNKGKSREELGLEPFTGTVIRSSVMGIKAEIRRETIAQLLNVPNTGKFLIDIDKGQNKITKYRNKIKNVLFETKDNYGKSTNMHIDFRLLFKILTSSVVPKVGSSDQISWDLKHLQLFLVQGVQLNLPAYLFHFLCGCIRNTQVKQTTLVAFPRLLSELFYQSGLVERLKEIRDRQVIHEIMSKFFTAEVLVNMQKIRKSELLYLQHPLLKKEVGRPFNANVPQVYKNEPLEVIVEYLRILRNDGHNVTMEDVQSEPDDELPRRRKQKQTVAQEEEPEPPQKKKKILRKIKAEAAEERTKHKHDQSPEEPKPAEVTPLVVQEDSEDIEDDLPLSKRPRKKAAPETSTQQGNDPASLSLLMFPLFPILLKVLIPILTSLTL
jgi:hypothetical protein